MTNEFSADDIKRAWQNQRTDQVQISLDDIYRKAQKLDKKVAWRNLIGFIACVLAIVGFGFIFFLFPNPMQRIGAALTIAGVLYITHQLYEHRGRDTPFGTGHEACINFLRIELEHQRELHRGLPFWLRLIAILPGPIVASIGFTIANPNLAGYIRVWTACFVALAIMAIPLNRREARKYQRQIDELDALEKQP